MGDNSEEDEGGSNTNDCEGDIFEFYADDGGGVDPDSGIDPTQSLNFFTRSQLISAERRAPLEEISTERERDQREDEDILDDLRSEYQWSLHWMVPLIDSTHSYTRQVPC